MLALVGFGGYAAHRFAANLASAFFAKLGTGAPPPEQAPVVSGLGSAASAYSGALGALVAAGVGVPLTMKFVEDPNTKQALVSGMVISALQMVAVSVLRGVAPGAADFLSGDDTAAKLSAMYGYRGLGQGGGGTSIMPRYAPIGEYYAPTSLVRPMGEYFSTPMGEYFSTPMNGLGEYFDSGVQGLGNYGPNGDVYEAAAGYGEVMTPNSNHIDPSSNLDHELSVAEAAAGVGQAYQAAAGIPYYEAQAGMRGLGDGVSDVPDVSTWIPGSSYPEIWAGVRPVNRPQQATAETPAGILATPGGAGILG